MFPTQVAAQNKTLQGKKARWVIKTELEERQKGKRCMRCNRIGCTSWACLLFPLKRSIIITLFTIIASTHADIEEENEGESENE